MYQQRYMLGGLRKSENMTTRKFCNRLTELNSYLAHDKVTSAGLSTKTTLLMEEREIDKILSKPTIIEIASDGGFNPSTGISSFGWVVAMNKTLIAMGRGPAAAHPDLAESFRAEGYGLAAVSWF
jgi:hypothetical protein